MRIGGGRFLYQLRSPQSSSDSPLEQAGSNRQYRVREPRFERGARVGSPCHNGEGGATRPEITTTAGVFRGTDGSNPASSTGESGANSTCRWTGWSSTNCSQAKPQLRTDMPQAAALPRPRVVQNFREVGLHQSRFAACASLLTSPASRRPPPKCRDFRL